MTPPAFSHHLQQTIEADEAFDVAALAAACALSRAQLHRRVRAATGVSPGVLIRRRRLARAAWMLREEQASVTEAVYAIGWNSLSHFAKVFRRRYGMPPSEYGALRAGA